MLCRSRVLQVVISIWRVFSALCAIAVIAAGLAMYDLYQHRKQEIRLVEQRELELERGSPASGRANSIPGGGYHVRPTIARSSRLAQNGRAESAVLRVHSDDVSAPSPQPDEPPATDAGRPAEGSQPFQPSPAVDARGFIDVWKLRRDVAAVEPLIATDDTDGCYPEGDPDDQQTPAEEKQQDEASAACEKQVHEAYALYEQRRRTLNEAWLPRIYGAIRGGDRVAEVIMRQCDTTEVLDRSGIESTCDPQEARQAVARARLKEIGFVPAFDLQNEVVPTQGVPHPNTYQENQTVILDRMRSGALGFNFLYVNPGTNLVQPGVDLSSLGNWLLIEAISQDAPEAFTFGIGSDEAGWATEAFGRLKLVRTPLTPGFLTWGPALHFGGGNMLYTGPHYWRSSPQRVFVKVGSTPIVITDSQQFRSRRAELLAAMQASIDRYLQQDPRWGVFLLHRVGHHEWVPEGTQSHTGHLDEALIGSWTLEKEAADWTMPMKPAVGQAVIRGVHDGFTISITSEHAEAPLQNVQDCELRYSGGLTFLPELGPHGEKPTGTLLGDFLRSNYDDDRAGQFSQEGANQEAVAPFDPKRRYRQILMICPQGESLASDRVRFLLSAGHTLVEFGAENPFHGPLHVREYWKQ